MKKLTGMKSLLFLAIRGREEEDKQTAFPSSDNARVKGFPKNVAGFYTNPTGTGHAEQHTPSFLSFDFRSNNNSVPQHNFWHQQFNR